MFWRTGSSNSGTDNHPACGEGLLTFTHMVEKLKKEVDMSKRKTKEATPLKWLTFSDDKNIHESRSPEHQMPFKNSTVLVVQQESRFNMSALGKKT